MADGRRRYPFASLAEAMGMSENQAIIKLAINGKAGQLYRHEGMTERVADRMAVKAGLHPFSVWPAMVDDAIQSGEKACCECAVQFFPTRAGHRFCSTACGQRQLKRERYRARYAADPAFRAAEVAKASAYRKNNNRAVAIKKARYYRHNAERIKAQKKARLAARRAESAQGGRGAVAA